MLANAVFVFAKTYVVPLYYIITDKSWDMKLMKSKSIRLGEWIIHIV